MCICLCICICICICLCICICICKSLSPSPARRCQIDKKFWKHLEALFQAKKTFQIINLNLNNCPQQNPKYFFKIVEALLNQNGLDLLNINFQQ